MDANEVRLRAGLKRREVLAYQPTGEVGIDREGRWVLFSIAVVTIAQFVFLTVGCDWDLCGDEAEYWAWSRNLDWSYFCRGPLIALMIRFTTILTGELSFALTGSLMPSVRCPAVLLGALTAWGVYRLASETTQNRRVGMFAALLLPAVPLFRLGGLLMTVDTPLVCCWTWAAVWSFRAVTKGVNKGWWITSVLVAVGILAKYTMLAFPASVGLYLILHPQHRYHLRKPGFWLLGIGCVAGMSPIVGWNIHHDWVAANQLAERVGLVRERPWADFKTLGAFLAGEFAVFGLWYFFAAIAVLEGLRQVFQSFRRRFKDSANSELRWDSSQPEAGRNYLLCLWVVIWLACAAASLRGESEANWGAPAHVAALVLMARWFDLRIRRAAALEIPSKSFRWAIGSLWVLSLISLTAIQHTEWFYPALSSIIPAPSARNPAPLRPLDPTCRMRGHHELAPIVAERLKTLRAQGFDPFVMTPIYTVASTLSFYLPGQPEVYCLSWTPGWAGRAANQHDLWHPNPRHDLPAFRGRVAVIVEPTARMPNFAQGIVAFHGLFRSADPTEHIQVTRNGQVVAAWDVTVCRDFQGLPQARALTASR